MSLSPDIWNLPVIGTFLTLALVVVLLLAVMKLIDLITHFKNKNLDIVELTLALTKFAILGAPAILIFYEAMQGQVPNAIDLIITMFVALFLWGTVKIIYDLIKEVF